MYLIVALIAAAVSFVVTNIFHFRHTRLGTLIIDDSNPEKEKWKILIDEGFFEKRHKRALLKIDRSTKL